MRYTTVGEKELDDAERAVIGALLASCFDTDSPEQLSFLRGHAHWGDAPVARVVARSGDRIVGQLSVFRMGEGVMGLGDVAVAGSHRRRGIARELVARGLRLCGDHVVLTRTIALRSVLAEHGFAPVQLAQLFPDPHWLGRGDLSRVGRLELTDV